MVIKPYNGYISPSTGSPLLSFRLAAIKAGTCPRRVRTRQTGMSLWSWRSAFRPPRSAICWFGSLWDVWGSQNEKFDFWGNLHHRKTTGSNKMANHFFSLTLPVMFEDSVWNRRICHTVAFTIFTKSYSPMGPRNTHLETRERRFFHRILQPGNSETFHT